MISPRMISFFIKYLPKGLVKFCSRKIVDMYINKYAHIEINGMDKVKTANKPVIFVCNHLSNADGLILSRVLENEDVTFVAGVKLSNDPVTIIGMNVVKTIGIKPNSADKEALSNIVRMIKDGHSILMFPEGTRSRTGSMIEGRKGILLIARLTGAPIMPVGIHGTEKLMPINKEGNMSSETFYHAKVIVNFGETFNLESRDKGEDRQVYEERSLTSLMKKIAALLPEEYRGVYK